MNYLSNLLQNFARSFSNLLEGTFGSVFSSSSGSLESTLPTVTYGAATSTSLDGTSKIDGDNETLGTSMVTTGSALSSAVNNTTDVDPNLANTQAYVEAMSDEELENFISKLEDVSVEYDLDMSLTKKINDKNV